MEYFKKLDGKKIKCNLCEHKCSLKLDDTGICGANVNDNGELKTLVYGYPVAVHKDPIEKKPLYNFMPKSYTFSIGTFGCNMKCTWCQNHELSQSQPDGLEKYNYFSPKEIVKFAIDSGCKSISYTYNEPTVFYPYAKEIGIIAKEAGLKNIFVTNGYQTEAVIDDMSRWVDACNVDLKSFNSDVYRKHIKADLDVVLRNLKLLKALKIHVEITTLIIPDLNDSMDELNRIADFISNKLSKDTPWHVSAFHPDYKMTEKRATSPQIVLKAKEIGVAKGLKHVYCGNIGFI